MTAARSHSLTERLHGVRAPGAMMRRAAVIGLWVALPSLWAHPISLITGEALVHRDRMELSLAVMPEDFLLVYGLSADANAHVPTADIEKSAGKHSKYLLDGLTVRDAEGNRLTGKLVNTEMPKLPADGLPVTDLMATTIVYHLEFPLIRPPTHLSFQQRFGAELTIIPSIVTLVVTREGLPPEPTLSVPGDERVETISFDWNETSRPATADYAETKARMEEKRKRDMGIASYSATYTFVYIQSAEVRVEILMPLLTLETWLPIPRTNADFLEVSEQLAARTTLEKFLTEQNELNIDGAVVTPKLDRLDFYGVEFKDFAMRAEPSRLSAWTARVGAMMVYPIKAAPRHLELKWTLFNHEMLAARAAIFAYDKGSRFTFLQSNPVFTWDSPGAPPLPTMSRVATSETSREVVVESLLRNLYRAFDYHSESDIYDALAGNVHGDLLAELYLKIKQGLIIQEQGGAVVHVEKVTLVKAEPEKEEGQRGFSERVTWQVEGTVEHWGHIHTRVNEYSADVEITPTDGVWKVAGMKVARQSQVKSAVVLRKL